ncbi:MAG: hypothetical protein HUU56_04790 [Bdellovibrionaceae bacterium]|nr:hypothetical protein [Pseudobdellovibrionaceae bacterium]
MLKKKRILYFFVLVIALSTPFNNCSSGGRNSAPDANVISSEPNTDNGKGDGENTNPEIDQRDEQMRIYGKASPLEVQNVYAKEKYSCIIDFNNLVRCWGTIDYLLGFRKILATEIENLGQVKFLSLGIRHACAITLDDKIKCWGSNESGQLGNNEISSQNTTVKNGQISEVVAIDKAKSVAVGKDHTCAITMDDKVKCWGNNLYGQLGDGSNTSSVSPVDVVQLGAVKAISLEAYYSCAITMDDKVKCWGNNYSGQLGNGTRQNTNVPGFVANLESVTSMVAGEQHVCVINSENLVKCWGQNGNGQLGRNDIIYTERYSSSSFYPVEVKNLNSVKKLALGRSHTCAITVDNKVKCWGRSDLIGNNSISAISLVAEVLDLDFAKSIALGSDHSCAINQDNRIRCWGNNNFFQQGHNSVTNSLLPTKLSVINNFKTIASGEDSLCYITNESLVKCLGRGYAGQLGDGNRSDSLVSPVDVKDLGPVKAITAGSYFYCAINKDDLVKCWGSNSGGELGDKTKNDAKVPVDVFALGRVKAISAGYNHVCAITENNHVKCWGANSDGQLGNRTNLNTSEPVDVEDLQDVKAIAVGASHSCVIDSLDKVKCWGAYGISVKSDVPVEIAGLQNVKVLSASHSHHTCALDNLGKVKCWGSNSYGQLGDGSMKSSDQPVNTSGLDPVKSIFVKSSRTCVVTNRNKTKCWGNSFYDGLTKTNSIVRPREIILNEDEIFNSKDIFVTNKMIFILDFNGQVYYMGKPHNSYRAPAGVVTNIQFRGADLNSYY